MGGTIIKKLCNSFSCATQRFQLVQDEKGHTTGFAFVEYQSKIEAERAIQKMHGQSLGQGRPPRGGVDTMRRLGWDCLWAEFSRKRGT